MIFILQIGIRHGTTAPWQPNDPVIISECPSTYSASSTTQQPHRTSRSPVHIRPYMCMRSCAARHLARMRVQPHACMHTCTRNPMRRHNTCACMSVRGALTCAAMGPTAFGFGFQAYTAFVTCFMLRPHKGDMISNLGNIAGFQVLGPIHKNHGTARHGTARHSATRHSAARHNTTRRVARTQARPSACSVT